MKLVAHAMDAASGRLIPLAPSSRAAKVLGDDLQPRAPCTPGSTSAPAYPTGSDDKFRPGYAIPDSDGHAAGSHIGAMTLRYAGGVCYPGGGRPGELVAPAPVGRGEGPGELFRADKQLVAYAVCPESESCIDGGCVVGEDFRPDDQLTRMS
ncbi:hypothetical protein ACWC4C_44830 [Streptomyces olivaceoviridis]